jgi:hypothetical protein
VWQSAGTNFTIDCANQPRCTRVLLVYLPSLSVLGFRTKFADLSIMLRICYKNGPLTLAESILTIADRRGP